MTGTASPPAGSPRAARAARLLTAAAALAGCFGRALPAPEFYRLRPPAPAAASRGAAAAAPAVPLTVEPYATPGVYAGPAIVYRVGDTQYGTYPGREWAVPLGTMLAALTAESLRQGAPAGGAHVRDADRAGVGRGLVWRGTVREFEEVDRGRGRGDAQVSAAVRLDAQLVRASDDSVVWRGEAQAQRTVVPAESMTAVVDSLAAAAGEAVAALVRDAAPAMRAASVSVTRPAAGGRGAGR
jgi:uncharacterized lipoprotein YmbA